MFFRRPSIELGVVSAVESHFSSDVALASVPALLLCRSELLIPSLDSVAGMRVLHGASTKLPPHGASSRRPALLAPVARQAVDEPSSPWCVEPSTEPSSPGASTKLPPHGASSHRPALLAPVARRAVDEPPSPWCVEPYHLAPLPFSIAPRLRLTHWHCGPQTLRTPRATAVPNDCVDDRTPAYLVCGMYAPDGGRLRSYKIP